MKISVQTTQHGNSAPNTTPAGFFDNATKDAYARGVDVEAAKKQAAKDDWKEFEAFAKEVELVRTQIYI